MNSETTIKDLNMFCYKHKLSICFNRNKRNISFKNRLKQLKFFTFD